jgi:hypothetical protein
MPNSKKLPEIGKEFFSLLGYNKVQEYVASIFRVEE